MRLHTAAHLKPDMRLHTARAMLLMLFAVLLHAPAVVRGQDLNYNGFPLKKVLAKMGSYTGFSKSVKKIHDWVDQGNWAAAFKQYSKRQVYGKPFRSMQTFAQGGTVGKYWKGEDTHDLYAAYYGKTVAGKVKPNPKYIEDFLMKQYNAKNKDLFKVAIIWLMNAFVSNQIDEAKLYISKPELNHVDWGKGEMDDTAILYTGVKGGVSMWSIHESTVKAGTKCTSLNKDLINLLIKMRDQGDANVGKGLGVWSGPGSWGENRRKVYDINNITFARLLWIAVGNNNQALANAYLSIMAPHLKDQGSVKKLRDLFKAKTGDAAAVKPLLTAILSGQAWIGAGRTGEVFCDKR